LLIFLWDVRRASPTLGSGRIGVVAKVKWRDRIFQARHLAGAVLAIPVSLTDAARLPQDSKL
jgi:hypothetical protein